MKSHDTGRRNALQRMAGGAALATGGLGGAFASLGAQAAAPWPNQSVKIVVPFAAGGSTDAFARLLARKLQESLGQSFVIENRLGANGNLGAATVAAAPADGYTLMLCTTGPLSLNKLLYKNTPFNPLVDFTPISLLADVPLLLAASPSVSAKDMRELLAYLKANPDKLDYSTGGNGSMGHLSALLLQRATGTHMVHVPYKGSAGALNDLLAGVVSLSFDLVPTYLPYISSGKVHALAVLSSERTSALPGVPTLKELGIDVQATGWYGLVGPKGIPQEVVTKVNAVTNEFLASTEGRAQMQTFSMRPIGGKPDALMKLMVSDTQKWGPIVEPIAASVVQ